MCSVFVRRLHERGVFWGYNLNGPYNVRYNRYISLLEKTQSLHHSLMPLTFPALYKSRSHSLSASVRRQPLV